ncbi:MAG: hypothetical protein ACU0A6_03365 [Shimia sp.]|uniref:hypothetical protein n=1 Tax=Shimia sp. TaxID=1954381 RepID=UPI00405895A0
MFIILAFFTLFGPAIASMATIVTAVILFKTRPALSVLLFFLICVLLTILLFEFRYDLGLELPDVDWMPSGANSEFATLLAACALLGLHIFTWIRWPADVRFKWVTKTASLLWGSTVAAFVVLSQLSYSI